MISCIKLKCFLGIAGAMILNFQSMAQPGGLNIGDKVPDIEFAVLNYPAKKVSLSNFAGKWVILDFWATWCSSCISYFPKMDSLEQRFKDRLQVILVSTKKNDTYKKVEVFLNTWKGQNKNFVLPLAVMDTVADVLFPHRSIPHYVWIGPDGHVKAITSAGQVTAKNISTVLNGGNIRMDPTFDLDIEKPLFLSDQITIDELTQYSIFRKGKLNGMSPVAAAREYRGVVRRNVMVNMTISKMYMYAANGLNNTFRFYPWKINGYNGKRMILHVSDPSKLQFEGAADDKFEWERENFYAYDLIVPVAESVHLYEYVLDGLNKYSGYTGRIEKMKRPCLILRRTSKVDKLATKGGKPGSELMGVQHKNLRNVPFIHLVLWLNNLDEFSFPVIDETNYTGNIDLTLALDAKAIGLQELNAALKPYDLELVQEDREIDMLVIEEKPL
jgi:thiol-disulfide isomerase/thioredoxin